MPIFFMGENLHAKLEEMLKPVITAMGYELWGLELHAQGAHSLLRVYVDSENGVNLDDLGRISYQISGLLDVEDPIKYKYTLEVSSPGIDRPLFTLEQFRRYIGSKVRIKVSGTGSGARRNYVGVINAIDGEKILIDCDGDKLELMLDQIEKANLNNNI